MSAFVDAVDRFGRLTPDAPAFSNSAGERITFGELKSRSDALARRLASLDRDGHAAVVYGHKSPNMPVAFFACAKSGRAYVPVDTIYPDKRVAEIIEQLEDPLFIDTTGRGASFRDRCAHYVDVCGGDVFEPGHPAGSPELTAVTGDDTFYILFTSGSTGQPKGVEISADAADSFWRWITSDFEAASGTALDRAQRVLFGRAPFSFDVSFGDMALALGAGDALYSLVEEDEVDLRRMFAGLESSGASLCSCTPTFAEICLRDPLFSPDLLPELNTFVLAGEALKGATVLALKDRFGGCRVINAYGPTESTDLVSSVEITRALAEAGDPLPIGRAKTGTELFVLDRETLEPVARGEQGELVIVGDTVAKGYHGLPDLTQAAFGCCPERLAKGRRSYRTGDAVAFGDDGLLYYHGRLDSQLKLHGYRIELGEIESRLEDMPEVAQACVLPVERRGSLSHLAACVVLAADLEGRGDSAMTRELKAKLAESLPEYMIPRKFAYFDDFPLNPSGKLDRKRLKELL